MRGDVTPPAGDKQGRYDWMKRKQAAKKLRKKPRPVINRQAIANDWIRRVSGTVNPDSPDDKKPEQEQN